MAARCVQGQYLPCFAFQATLQDQTIDLEIFIVKNIFVACINHENINHKIYLTIDNHYTVSTFCTHGFTTQLASYFVQDSLLTCGKSVTTFLVSDKLPQFEIPTAFLLHVSISPTAAWWP